MEWSTFLEGRIPYLQYLYSYQQKLVQTALRWEELLTRAQGAQGLALVTVDAVRGFCSEGPMHSPQMAAIIPTIVNYLTKAHQLGVRELLFTCDNHLAESREFRAYPAHCLAGSSESRLEERLENLECAELFKIFPKESISSLVDTRLLEYLAGLPNLRQIVLMGGVTDLCLYHLAAGLLFFAITRRHPWQLIIPAQAVATFDSPTHDAGLLQPLFLEHLQSMGVEVVGGLT